MVSRRFAFCFEAEVELDVPVVSGMGDHDGEIGLSGFGILPLGGVDGT